MQVKSTKDNKVKMKKIGRPKGPGKSKLDEHKDEIEKLADKLFKEADKLLEDKKPYEARQLLFKLRGAFSGTDYSEKAQEKMDKIDNDKSLKDELVAGGVFAKGLKYESQEKTSTAKKMFERVVAKYPKTEYAKRAKEKIKSLEEKESDSG